MPTHNDQDVTSETSAIWANHVTVAGAPVGFTVRTTVPANPNGVEVMLERWEAGTSEPPHSHPGDDMTVVVEGRMQIQFYQRQGERLVPDGSPVLLERGQTGYVRAGRIHDAQYLADCKLVYVHDRVFGFQEEKQST
jgi:quercetin dioxygenase-like cupin family protein